MRAIYLHGFASSPASRKAQVFAERLAAHGLPCQVPALDGGDFEHLTLSAQLDRLTAVAAGEPVVLLGSSMGGYLAALYAARHPEVERLVLLAPAFGFAHRWPQRLGPAAVAAWRDQGSMEVFHYASNSPRRVGYALLEDGLAYEPIPAVTQPTLIFHGRQDPVVPFEFSLEFQQAHPQAEVRLFDAGHELTEVIEEMWTATAAFLRL